MAITYSDRFVERMSDYLGQLRELKMADYTTAQIKDVLSGAGSAVELFLKGILFPSKSTRHNFKSFIDELSNHGISQASVGTLHNLRIAYNNSKHEPSYEPTLMDAEDLMQDVIGVAEEVAALGIGKSVSHARVSYKRVFWISAWDHFAHGDSEVHIMLPSDTQHWLGPPTLDIIYTKIDWWPAIKQELSQPGEVRPAEGEVPDRFFNKWAKEGDFCGAFVFEGDYRELMAALSRWEKRNELIPFLMRHANYRSMLQAFSMAVIDVANGGLAPSGSDLSKEIRDQATGVYAVPSDMNGLEDWCTQMAQLLTSIPSSTWPLVTGPTWVGKDEFDAERDEAFYCSEDHPVLLNRDYVVRIQQP